MKKIRIVREVKFCDPSTHLISPFLGLDKNPSLFVNEMKVVEIVACTFAGKEAGEIVRGNLLK